MTRRRTLAVTSATIGTRASGNHAVELTPIPRNGRLPLTLDEIKTDLDGVTIPNDIDRDKIVREVQRRLSIAYALPLQPIESLKRWERLRDACQEINHALVTDPIALSTILMQDIKFILGNRNISFLETTQMANLFLGAFSVELNKAITLAKTLRRKEFSRKNPNTLALYLIALLPFDIPALKLNGIGDTNLAREIFIALGGDSSTCYKLQNQFRKQIRKKK